MDYGPDVIEEVEAGPRPRTALDVTIFSADPSAVRPVGFLSALFAVLGKPGLKGTRLGVSRD